MTTKLPNFDTFKGTVDEAAMLASEAASSGQKESKFFAPGTYEVVIKNAEYHQPLSGDSTWHGFKLMLEEGGKSIRSYLSVPTRSDRYMKPGLKPEHQLLMFHKLREFMRAIGEECDMSSMPRTLKLFSRPEFLHGKKIKIEVGYNKPHLEFVAEEKLFRIVDRKGNEIFPDMFPDRTSAIAFAAEKSIRVDSFPEILKYYPGTKSDDSEDEWK